MFFLVLIILIIISVAWAIHSYYQLKNIVEVEGVKEDLQRGHVIFHSDSLSSESEGSSTSSS